MICTYRVTLEGKKGFFRLYKINTDSTLYAFHKQLQADLEFALDQPILFKSLDAAGGVAARYALVDLGAGTVDDVTVDAAIKAGSASFLYFYDVKSKRYVIITLEGEPEPGRVEGVVLLESKGPVPEAFDNGYVAFEDLPKDRRHLPGEHNCGDDDCDCCDDDDEDDEEDGEKDGDEDGEEIYDENE